MKAVFDTGILIDYLNGIQDARAELARYRRKSICLITWMEVLCGCHDPEEEKTARGFLATFETIPITDTIAEKAVIIRRESRLRLPDAMIWATAQTSGALLVTRNTRDFPANDPGVRVPYRV